MTAATLTASAYRESQRRLPAALAYGLTAFVLGVSQFASVAPAPLYRTYGELWHFSSLTLTLIYATYAFGVLAVLLVAGRISDEVGRRPVLLASLGTLMAAVAVFLVADSTAWLFIARGLQGVATGAVLGTASAALLDLHRRQDAASVAITTTASATAGLGLGILATSVAVAIGWEPLRLPYVVLLALLAVAIAGVRWMPETVAERKPFALTVARPRVPAAVRGQFVVSSLAALATWSLGGLFFSLGPELGAHVLGTNSVVGAGLGVVVLSFTATSTQLTLGRLPAWLGTTAGAVVLAVGALLIVLATVTGSSELYFTGAVVAGAGWGLAFIGGLRGLNAAIPPEHRASVLSAYYVVSYAALSVPAILAGALVDRLGLQTTFEWFGVAVAALALFVAIAAWLTRPKKEEDVNSIVQAPGITRTDLQEHDLSIPGRQVIQNKVELGPEAPAVRHKHPGEEIIYVLEGSLEYSIDGLPPKTYHAGEALLVPAETVHSVRNVGDGNAAELATYVVEKGKPFLVVVD
jgi:quercetin dioxygenase-like cupin family protein/predicted MFS family arabinose efflux permease